MAIPLGWGSETSEAVSQAIAREAFLAALHELIPQAISDLLANDAMRQIVLGMMAPTPPLADHIEYWQACYRLQEPWFGEMAFLTLLSHATGLLGSESAFPWAAYPGGIAMAIHGDPGHIWSVAVPIILPAMEWEWDPTFETRAAAKSRMLAELERSLEDQIHAALGEDVLAVPAKNAEHFRWLVLCYSSIEG